MYLLMVSSSKPTVLTQYPQNQKCRPDTRFWSNTVRRINTTPLRFRKPITMAMLYFGGTLKHMWIWSIIKCPSISSTPRCRHNSRIISPTRLRNFPYSFFWRYLGTNTIWYLKSHLTCDKFGQSCIGNHLCLPLGTFPG